MLASLAACGSTGESGETTADSGSSETSAEKPEYEYPALDFGGRDFVFLMTDSQRNTQRIDVEMTGSVLDDAIYERNRVIEEMFNVNLVQTPGTTYDKVNSLLRSSVMAGDDEYQVAFPLTDGMASLITDGLVWNLNESEYFRFDQPWWDQAIMADASIGGDGAVYFASSNIYLHNFEMSWCIYFNRRMVTDLGLELPYQTVLDGKWTYDKLYEYASAGHNLNGDDSYAFNKDGSCVYGFASMNDCVYQSFVSCGEKFIDMNGGDPVLTLGSDRFYTIADKLAKLYGEEGVSHFGNDRNSGSHYENVYAAGRAMFLGAEIKGGNAFGMFSEMQDDYGIIPMPKLDEAQENYISPVAVYTFFMMIPMTNDSLDETAQLLDAMAYLSYKNVVPAYYDITLTVKNIRDDETVDMLNIIRDTRTYLTCYALGWGNSFRSELSSKLRSGSSDLASTIATHKTTIESEISKTLEAIK